MNSEGGLSFFVTSEGVIAILRLHRKEWKHQIVTWSLISKDIFIFLSRESILRIQLIFSLHLKQQLYAKTVPFLGYPWPI